MVVQLVIMNGINDTLNKIMSLSNFEYIADNIYNSTSKSNIIFPNQVVAKIFQVDEIKISIIGLVTIKTPIYC